MKLIVLHTSVLNESSAMSRMDRIILKISQLMKNGYRLNIATFQTLDSLGITDLQERIKLAKEIKTEMQKRSAAHRRQKTKEIPDYFFF